MKLLLFFLALTAAVNVHAGNLTPAELEQKTAIQCSNLIYASGKTSVCFADHFLGTTAKETGLAVQPKFREVKLDSNDICDSPFTVISGDGSFRFSDKERANLKQYLTCGGFLLASPGCSDKNWDQSFRAEIKAMFPEAAFKTVPMTHPLFSAMYNIPTLTLKGGGTTLVESLELNGRMVMIYSTEGLNDAHNAKGCCCCGGNQILESEQVNVNILLYALLH